MTPRVSALILPPMEPKFLKRGICNWNLNCLGHHIWVHPVIDFFYFLCIFGKVYRADTTTGFGRNLFKFFKMPIIPKYPYAWWCISTISICSAYQNMLFSPAPLSTINYRRPHPYLLARLIKWSFMSTPLCISFVAWR